MPEWKIWREEHLVEGTSGGEEDLAEEDLAEG